MKGSGIIKEEGARVSEIVMRTKKDKHVAFRPVGTKAVCVKD